MKSLAREIDRLGTGGDPTRVLRTQCGEAAFVARAVERMVGNLEFRSKHGDADLEQIVEKERKVAEEIHGGLMQQEPAAAHRLGGGDPLQARLRDRRRPLRVLPDRRRTTSA